MMTTDTQPTPTTLTSDDAASTDVRNIAEPTLHSRAQPDSLPEMERLEIAHPEMKRASPKLSTRTGRIARYEGNAVRTSEGAPPVAEPPQPRPRMVEEPGSTTRLPKFFAQPREGEDQAKGADDSATDSQPDL